MTFAVVAAVIIFLGRMTFDRSGIERGIPIRGYGLFLLLGIVSGVALAAYRGSKRGISPEVIQNLAVWMVVPGIIGARLFFVLQKWPEFHRDSWRLTLVEILRLTEGGLVVFGALIGAVVGFVCFCRRYTIPPLPLADVIAPSLLVGLACGRLGCLMNGCCYGGLCSYPWAITFPEFSNAAQDYSPVYGNQLYYGVFDGVKLTTNDSKIAVESIESTGPAAAAGLRLGDVISTINGVPASTLEVARELLFRVANGAQRTVELQDGRTLQWTVPLPPRSRPVHPTQIYSTVNAVLLLLFLLALEPLVNRDGVLIATALTLKAITRSLLEVIRDDEASVGATGLTISQIVGLGILLFAVGIWFRIAQQPPSRTRQIPVTPQRSPPVGP